MKNYEIIADVLASANIERLRKKDSDWSFVRIRFDTDFGPIYVRPITGSKEEIILNLMADKYI